MTGHSQFLVSFWHMLNYFHKDVAFFFLVLLTLLCCSVSSVQLLSCVQLFATPWITACHSSLSICNSQNLLKLLSIKSVMPFSHLILCRPLLFLSPIPPSIRVFAVAAAAKSLQSCLTLCDPIDGSPPGSMSLGFSRQEHWSGLPFPSPMHESEKWKWSRSVMSNSLRPQGLQPTRLLCPWDFPDKSTGVGCHCLLRLCC